jgi:hypothetical protein
MARTLNEALAANYTATTNMERPLRSEALEDMQWTVPGTDTLTPQALNLTNTYIDQSKFPEGVSPLTKLYRQPSPVPLDAPWTEQELERLSSLSLNRTVTPPPRYPHLRLLSPEAEMEPDTLMEHMGQVNVQDEDIFMQPAPAVKSPVYHSPRRSVQLTHDEDQVMEHEMGDEYGGQDGLELPHSQELEHMWPKASLAKGDGRQEHGTEKEHPKRAPGGQDRSAVPDSLEEEEMCPKDTLETGKHHQECCTEISRPKIASAGAHSSTGDLVDSPPAKTPLQHDQNAPTWQLSLLPPRRIKSKTIIMSSSDEEDGESELSEPPPSPVRKKREPTKSTSHPQTEDLPDPVSSLRHSLGANFGSKSTLHGSLGSRVRGPTTMVTEPAAPVSECVFSSFKPGMLTALPVQMVKEPFSFQYFSLDPDSEPKTYNFYTHQKVVRQLAFSPCTI